MPMRLEAHQVGDIVEVDRLGRRFHALLAGKPRAAYRSSRLTRAQLQELPSP
jgi:hypothetical protein